MITGLILDIIDKMKISQEILTEFMLIMVLITP